MRLVFLGTSSMVPTKERNVSSVFCEHRGDCYLFDCGEGTQRQMNIAGINRHRVDTILLSHWHGDHMSGLIGLLQTKAKIPDPDPVTIIGPRSSKKRFRHLRETCSFNLSYEVDVVEVEDDDEVAFRNNETVVKAKYLDHTVPCVGFRVEEHSRRRVDMEALRDAGVPEGPHVGLLQEGEPITFEGETYDPETYTYVPACEKIGYVVDSRPCKEASDLAEGVDVFICESTFDDDHAKRAEDYKHMTAREAAHIADGSGVDELYLTHFSQRFRDVDSLVEEARSVFSTTYPAHDFLEVDVSASEEKRS